MNQAQTKEVLHHHLGASTCERWYNCPGSIELSRHAPKEAPSEYAAEGTCAHEVAAEKLQLLFRKAGMRFNHNLGSKRIINGFTFPITDEMLESVDVYTDLISKYMQDYNLHNDYLQIERKVKIPWPGHDPMFGTADSIIHVPFHKLIVLDFKYGSGTTVDAFKNKQGMYYALGAWLELQAKDPNIVKELPTVDVIIVQPRGLGKGIDIYECPSSELMQFHGDLLEHADATLKPNAKLCAGDWCKFCPAKLICPELKAEREKIMQIDFAEIQVGTALSHITPVNMGPQELAQFLDIEGRVEAVFKEVHLQAYKLAESGVEIPGYVLTQKRSNRAWIDEIKAAETLKPILGEAIFKEPSLKSPNGIDQEVKAQKKDSKLSKEVLEKLPALLKSLFENPDKGRVLAPADGKRVPVKPSAISDFDNVEAITVEAVITTTDIEGL